MLFELLLQLYKINQHWSLDYEVLKKQLQELEKPAEHQNSAPTAAPVQCRKCVLLEGEINTKSELLLDVQHTLEKLKIRNQDAEADLMEKERDVQQLKNECDSLSMQVSRQYRSARILVYSTCNKVLCINTLGMPLVTSKIVC